MPKHRTITIRAEAPPKPAWGEPCNGCGICCLSEPCPVGQLVSRRRHGTCDALAWDGHARRYTCGMLGLAGEPLAGSWFTRLCRRLSHRLMRRWIAAGIGCDCDIEPV